MGKYILALDQGTTSSRAILFDSEQNILAIRQHELTQHYPHEGWVEQDPMEIWSTQYATMFEVLGGGGYLPCRCSRYRHYQSARDDDPLG